jgi:hypothetical protein
MGLKEPKLSRDWRERVIALGDFIAYCRTQVQRESFGAREIMSVPEAESATRISQQLCQLLKGSAMIDHRPITGPEDWRVVRRVGFDCMPPARRAILDGLISGAVCGIKATTHRYAMEELTALGVLDELGQLSPRSIQQLRIFDGKKTHTSCPPYPH